MEYYYLGHRTEKDRTFIELGFKTFFGLKETVFECVDSNQQYTATKETCWYKYPSFEQIMATDNLHNFLNNTMKYLKDTSDK